MVMVDKEVDKDMDMDKDKDVKKDMNKDMNKDMDMDMDNEMDKVMDKDIDQLLDQESVLSHENVEDLAAKLLAIHVILQDIIFDCDADFTLKHTYITQS